MDEFRTPEEEAERIVEKNEAYWSGFAAGVTTGSLGMAVASWVIVILLIFITKL